MTTAPRPPGRARSRRSPAPDERQVDPARTRQALLDAALEEFSARGYAGARVRDIADRAGVSKDLISYHFGGKDGLYREVQRAWLARESTFYDHDLPLAELAARYLHDALADPRPMRLLGWRGLAGEDSEPPDITRAPEDLSGLRARQDRGEIAADLDPATLRLALLGAIAAPVLLPQAAARIFGADPASPDFEARYSAGLARLLARLAPGSP
ncbi:MAG: TetR/AcrR family transcriptional regulator, partial [Streptosporangiaceae bacterium]